MRFEYMCYLLDARFQVPLVKHSLVCSFHVFFPFPPNAKVGLRLVIVALPGISFKFLTTFSSWLILLSLQRDSFSVHMRTCTYVCKIISFTNISKMLTWTASNTLNPVDFTVFGWRGTPLWFQSFFSKEDNFVASCLRPWMMNRFKKESHLKGKNFL